METKSEESKSESWEQPEDWRQFIEGKYCPLDYKPCKWSDANEIYCVHFSFFFSEKKNETENDEESIFSIII